MMVPILRLRLSTVARVTRPTRLPRYVAPLSILRRGVLFPSAARTYATTPAKPKKGSIGATAKRVRATSKPETAVEETASTPETKTKAKSKAKAKVKAKTKAKTRGKATLKKKKKRPTVSREARAKKAAARAKATATKKAKVLRLREKKREARAKAKSPEERIKLYKKLALSPPPSARTNAWTFFWAAKARNELKGQSVSTVSTVIKGAASEFRALSASEKESYERQSREASARKERELKAWVQQHSAQEIREANLARSALRRLTPTRKNKIRWAGIKDDRRPKLPVTPYLRFASERTTGVTGGARASDLARQSAQMWKTLDASQKQTYVDAYEQERQRYITDYERVFGVKPGQKASSKSRKETASVTESS